MKYDAYYDTTFTQVSPMKNGNRLVISLADYKMDDGRYTCQVQRIILGIKNSNSSSNENSQITFQLSAQRSVELEHTVRVRGKSFELLQISFRS